YRVPGNVNVISGVIGAVVAAFISFPSRYVLAACTRGNAFGRHRAVSGCLPSCLANWPRANEQLDHYRRATCELFHSHDELVPYASGEGENRAAAVRGVADKHGFSRGHLYAGSAVVP